MKREIGSNFWFSPEDIIPGGTTELSPGVFGISSSDFVWLSSCRSAISLVIDEIEKRNTSVSKIVCLPAFTCHTVYQPFISKGYDVVMLPVEMDLTISTEKAVKIIQDTMPGIVLFHKFFGFETIPGSDQIIKAAKVSGAVIIEDLTQSMYSKIERLPADYYVGSIRKWCGVVDGGFAVCKEGKFIDHPTAIDTNIESYTRKASELKLRYMNGENVDKAEFLSNYRTAKDCIDNQDIRYAISPLSQSIQCNLDLDVLSAKRRENFRTLLNGIKGIDGIKPVFTDVPSFNVPLYFPIICDDRKKLQSLLAKHDIYAPIIWPKEDDCPPVNTEANFLYENMLCIPIDQRYDTDDMLRIVSIIKENFLWTGWMTWEQILPFKEQVIDWELEVIVKYHYPDMIIPRSFCEEKVNALETHLKNGNTFFWGAVENGQLIGYYWGYVSEMLFESRWNEHSSYLSETARNRGLGMRAKLEALQKAKERGCVKSVSMYAPFNEAQRHIYEKLGFEISRIEVVKRL